MSSFNNPHGTLRHCLADILSVVKPSEDDIRARNQFINDFRAVVLSVESLKGATVEPFGSFVSNLYTRWGDLDISIELPCGLLVSSAGKKRKQNSLRELRKILQRRGIVHNLQFIPNARVPLLIFETNRTNISCDISINNLLGQIKSKFFLWISEIDERFRDMVLLIKEWAKSQNINDPKTGTLNSYSLSLLVIFHFQTCDPAILPPLNEIYPGNIVDDLTGVRFNVERNIKGTCTANIARFRNGNRSVNKSSLSELFVSFFEKFSRINMMASQQVICTYTGRLEYKRSSPKWTSKDYPLLIEDPFEQPDNAARAVSMSQLPRISEAFDRTYRKLLLLTPDQNDLISNLVRQHIASDIIRRTRSIPTAPPHGVGIGYHQQRSTAVPQYQSQFQNMRFENHPSPNVSFQRPASTVQGQSQQMWRPRYADR